MDEIEIIHSESDKCPDNFNNNSKKNNDIVFLPSRINDEAPFNFKITLFLFGFFGIQVLALVIQFILGSFIKDQILLISLDNFLTYLFAFIGVLLFLSLFERGKYLKYFFSGFKKKNIYIWGILALSLAILIETVFSLINTGILKAMNYTGEVTSLNEQSIDKIFSSSYFPLIVIPVLLFAPFIEECTYRVGLIDTVGKTNRIKGLIISSLIFGLVHFNGFTIILQMIFGPTLKELEIVLVEGTVEELSMKLLVEVLNLPVYMLMGACLGLAYLITGEISASIFAHTMNNLLSTIFSLLSGTTMISSLIPDFMVRYANFSISPFFSSLMALINK